MVLCGLVTARCLSVQFEREKAAWVEIELEGFGDKVSTCLEFEFNGRLTVVRLLCCGVVACGEVHIADGVERLL